MQVLITRAREDAEPLADALDRSGVQSIINPLLEIVLVPGPPLDLTAVQGLLMTSANGVRTFGQRSDNRSLPVYAVGDATAREAKKTGFTTVFSASGDVEALADLVRGQGDRIVGSLLHCTGTKIAGDLGGLLESYGYTYRRERLYEAVSARRFNPQTIAEFEAGQIDGVLLYSPRTAAIFVDLVRHAKLEPLMKHVTAYCLSHNVEVKISELVWKSCRVATVPEQDALISLIAEDN